MTINARRHSVIASAAAEKRRNQQRGIKSGKAASTVAYQATAAWHRGVAKAAARRIGEKAHLSWHISVM